MPIVQVQRVQSLCALFEGIIARQRELHARAADFMADQAAMDSPSFPRKGAKGPVGATEDSGNDALEGHVGGAKAVGGGFAPSQGEIDQTFLFAMIWGLGGGLTGDPALAFDVYVRDIVQVRGFSSVIEKITEILLHCQQCNRAQEISLTTPVTLFSR